MSIRKEDGFYVDDDREYGQSLGIETGRLEYCIEKINEREIRAVFGSPSFGFEGANLDFLRRMPQVEKVWFWDVELADIDGLYALSNLEFFGVHPKRPAIDFAQFPNLRTAIIEPKAKDTGLGSLRALTKLHVWHYRPSDKSFTNLAIPTTLIELQISWANASTLDSLPSLPQLSHLEVHRCRNLESLGDLSLKFPKLRHFVVTTCGRVTEDEAEKAVQNLKEIQHAWVQKWHVVGTQN